MEFVDLALCERHDTDVHKAQSLVDSGNVLLVATNAVQRLGVDDIKLALCGIRMPGTRLAPEMARSAYTSTTL